MARWDDLSDDELAARLRNRGLSYTVASTMVRDRSDPDMRTMIDDYLD